MSKQRSRKKGRRKQQKAAAAPGRPKQGPDGKRSAASVETRRDPGPSQTEPEPAPSQAERNQREPAPTRASNRRPELTPASVTAPDQKAPSAEAAAKPASQRAKRVRVRRGRVTQIVRRTVLALSLLSIFVLPLAALANARADWGGAFEVGNSGPGPSLARSLPFLGSIAELVSGSVWSMTIGGFELADPLAATLVTATSRTGVLLLAALLPVLATLLLGRVFCGWLCPARLPVELAAWARRRRRPRRVFKAPWLRRVKYGVLIATLILAVLLGWNLLALVYPPAILVREGHYLLTYGTLGWGALLLGVVLAADLLVDGGVWCRGLCPGGALYSLLARWAPLRMRLDEERCIRCHRCKAVCPLGLDPTSTPGGECDRCGLCRRECRDSALDLRFQLPTGRRDGRN